MGSNIEGKVVVIKWGLEISDLEMSDIIGRVDYVLSPVQLVEATS